jgi:catechol 2,3-dioxygenase-like lactoylglutathione lyase family enzyme
MSSSATSNGDSQTQSPEAATVALKLEVVNLPVADVDRAKAFYQGLGWRLDADATGAEGDGFRVVQVTPPASPAAIIFGQGITDAEPGSVRDLMLVVEDIDAARQELISRGADVSEVFHYEGRIFHSAGTERRVSGPDPQGRSYSTWASFSDPDGNGWLLQEIKTRIPGREWGPASTDINRRAELLRETAEHHGHYEATHQPHDWWDWYAPYMLARESGSSPEDAVATADRYMDEVRHVQPL